MSSRDGKKVFDMSGAKNKICCVYVTLEQSGQLEPTFTDVAARSAQTVLLQVTALRYDVGERMD